MIQMECFLFSFIIIILFLVIWKVFYKKEFIESPHLPVFISGCDTGLGNRLAIYLDSLGCDVFAGCLNPSASRSSLPESVTVIPLDICREDSVKEAVLKVEEILKEKGKNLWALINNAGVCVYGEFEWQTWNQCQKQVEVNLLGTMRLTKAFLPLIRKSEAGRLITITSINGFVSYPGLSIYSATKFALEGLSHSLRLELRRQHGIKVIIVEPGDFARLTSIMAQHEQHAEEMWKNMSAGDQEQYGDFFRMYHRVTLNKYGLTSPKSFENSPLLEDMKDAVLNVNPCSRYISASVEYRMFFRFLQLMPFWFVDKFLDCVTNTLYKSDRIKK